MHLNEIVILILYNNLLNSYVYCYRESTNILGNLSNKKRNAREATSKNLDSEETFPFVVSLQRGSKFGQQFCNGAIVARDAVVTSVICCKKDVFKAHQVYAVASGSDKSYDNAVINKILACIKYPKSDDIVQHNIALLKLENSFEFSNFIRPIKMAATKIPENRNLKVAGWGSFQDNKNLMMTNKNFKVIEMMTADHSICEENSLLPVYEKLIEFCAYIEETNKNFHHLTPSVCYFDYGLPITYNNRLVGISYSNILCNLNPDNDQYSFFSNITFYRDWINKVTTIEFRNREEKFVVVSNTNITARILPHVFILFIITPVFIAVPELFLSLSKH